MRAVELTEELLRRVEFRELERTDLGDTLTQERIDFFMSSQFKRAVVQGDRVIMALGGVVKGDAALTWMIASNDINLNPVASFEVLMELEGEAMRELKIKTLFTYNLPEFPFAINFLKRVGYREFGLKGGFKDGKDRILLVKEAYYGS